MSRKFLLVLAFVAFGLVGVAITHSLQPHGVLPAQADAASARTDSDESSTISPDADTEQAADSSNLRPDDAQCALLLKDADHGEAVSWLNDASTNRGVARWQKSEVVDLLKDFYKAGAARISVVDTDTVGGTEIASQFVIELPTDAAARKKIFDREATFEAEYQDAPTKDQGQKYLHITTD